MTPREQIALFLFVVLGSTITILCLLDWALEKYDAYLAREKVWREIEIRCARERHPSYQDQPYDWAKEEW